MWRCPKCGSAVDGGFEACWACGTTPEGVEDPGFVTADEAGPISEATDFLRLDAGKRPIDGELAEPPLELVEGFRTGSFLEARHFAEALAGLGIASTIEQVGRTAASPSGYPCRILVRAEDVPRMAAIVAEFETRRRAR